MAQQQVLTPPDDVAHLGSLRYVLSQDCCYLTEAVHPGLQPNAAFSS